MKYDNYEELLEAYNNGELTSDDKLMLDNDCTFVYKDDKCVFRGDGYYDIQKLAILAGFPAEWV